MPTTPSTINYYIAADGTLRDGSAGSIAQTPRIYYGTEYAVTLSFPASTIAEGDQLQVAVNRTRTFFSSASATGDAPVAAVAKHEVTAAEADAQAVTLTLSTNTRAMIDQVNGIDHPVRGFFGVHLLRGQSFISLAVADAFMLSVESGPDAISPSLPVVDYPTREEAEALTDRSEAAAERAEQAAAGIVPPLQLDAPPTTSTVGSVGQLAVYHDTENNTDHLYHLVFISTSENATLYHWEECVLVSMGNVAGGYPVLDANGKVAAAQLPINTFKLGGTSALSATEIAPVNGEIIIPLCSSNGFANRGLLFVDGYYGFSVASNHAIQLTNVTNDNINNRLARRYFALNQLDYAVRSVLPNVTEIPAATSDYSLVDSSATTLNHSHTFVHTPSQASTYRLPSVSDTTISHYIELTVDFTSVQTFSFVPPQDSGVTFQSYANPNLGDVWVFRCVWYGGKWRICPLKIKNCVTRQLTSGALSITDAVAGDALALKMTAPRSVVVNQLVQNGDFSDGITNWDSYYGTASVSSNICSIAKNANNATSYILNKVMGSILSGHHYLYKAEVYVQQSNTVEFALSTSNATVLAAITSVGNITVNVWVTCSVVVPATASSFANDNRLQILFRRSSVIADDVCKLRNIQLVDLTQYFNGNTTLINSITSWDDLVAYDPRFAQYVQYNMGEVTGVQPTVKVTGKNLFDAFTAPVLRRIGTITYTRTSDGVITATNASTISNSLDLSFVTVTSDLVGRTVTIRAKVNSSRYANTSELFFSKYKDGTWYSVPNYPQTYKFKQSDIGYLYCLHFRTGTRTSSSDVFIWSEIQAEFSSTATPYEPYHDGGTATSPQELFAVGNAADEYEAVAGTLAQTLKQVDLSTLTWTAGDGTYSATITDIKPSTANILLPNGYVGSVSGTTLTITASAMPTGTMVYEKATKSTTDVTPVQIDLQSGNNVAMQTDGGRLAPIDITYESNEI